MPRSRAYRRHQKELERRRMLDIFLSNGMNASEAERMSKIYSAHPKMCSCWMCGNPRKWFGRATNAETISVEDELKSYS